MPNGSIEFLDEEVTLVGRPRLAVRSHHVTGYPERTGRPFLLVHGLASNARLWDGVAAALAARGHPSIAVDLRGHGRSEAPGDGYDTDTCADDLAALLDAETLTGHRAPVVVGQSWGGNVVLSLAARYPGRVAAVGCVDGGWIRLSDSFASFEECWAVLAPPRFGGMGHAELVRQVRAAHPDWPDAGIEGTLANLVELPDGGVRARLDRGHHRSILRSLYDGDPEVRYPAVTVPVLLIPALGESPEPGEDPRTAAKRSAVRAAVNALPRAAVSWYPGADHDLHAQHPERLAADLAALARTTEENPR